MNQTSETIALPIPLDMRGKGVSLFEVNGTVHPYAPRQSFLYADFIESSIVNSNIQMPILRINLRKKRKTVTGSHRSLIYKKYFGYQPIEHP